MKVYKHICQRPNIGDEINDWFWHHLIGSKLEDTLKDDLLVGIGTVLNSKLPRNITKHVLGSGTGYDTDNFYLNNEYVVHFVRGPYTAKKLNLPEYKSVTDPAILISELKPFNYERDIPISFMPHVGIDSPYYKDLIVALGWNYISPSDDEDLILSQIARSKKLITSAMHGAIFADSYRTPWFPVTTSSEILEFKWLDWTKSMGIIYAPKRLPAYWGKGKSFFQSFKANIKKIAIQRKLLSIYKKEKFILSNAEIFQIKKALIRKHISDFKSSYL